MANSPEAWSVGRLQSEQMRRQRQASCMHACALSLGADRWVQTVDRWALAAPLTGCLVVPHCLWVNMLRAGEHWRTEQIWPRTELGPLSVTFWPATSYSAVHRIVLVHTHSDRCTVHARAASCL